MTEEEFVRENIRLGHAIQSGIKMYMDFGDTKMGDPKHLRVGVNLALVEQSAVARLLILKGVISEEEYFDAIVGALEKEKRFYEEDLSQITGLKVTLQ